MQQQEYSATKPDGDLFLAHEKHVAKTSLQLIVYSLHKKWLQSITITLKVKVKS